MLDMEKTGWFRIARWAVIFLSSVSLISACSGISNDVIKKQREGLIYQISYEKAFQCTMLTLIKKGISIDKIDKGIGFISTQPRQIREEKYVYQIIIRPMDKTRTSISVICNWSISPGFDYAFVGIPSAIAKSKSKELEIELADGIREEITKMQGEAPPISNF